MSILIGGWSKVTNMVHIDLNHQQRLCVFGEAKQRTAGCCRFFLCWSMAGMMGLFDSGTTYLHTYIHTHIHTYTHTHIHTYIHTYTHTYTHTYIHTYIYTYTHTYIYIYALVEHVFCCWCRHFQNQPEYRCFLVRLWPVNPCNWF